MRSEERKTSIVAYAVASSVSVWLAYAVQESWFAVVMPWMSVPAEDFGPLNRPYSFALYALYPLIGLLLGFSLAAVVRVCTRGLKARSESISRCSLRVAALALVLVFCGNYIIAAPNWSRSTVGLYVMLALILGVGVIRTNKNRLIDLLSNPFVCPFVVLAVPWLRVDLPADGWARELAVTAGWVLILLLLSLGCRVLSEFLSEDRRAVRQLVPVVAAAMVTLVALWAADTKPVTAAYASSDAANADRPNLILIVMDTVRADHLSVYGYERPTTPNLERFAEAATLYRRAVAAADLTLPSHASIFTGLYVSWHNARFGEEFGRGSPLDDQYVTLAEVLRDEGYRTIGIAANHGYLQPAFNLQQGFEYFDARGPHPLHRGKPWHLRGSISRGICSAVPLASCSISYRAADEINEEALPKLDELAQAGKPFFLFLNYMDAHWPYEPPAPYDRMFPGRMEGFTTQDFSELTHNVLSERAEVDPEVREHLFSQYDGAIAYEDAELGKLFMRMKELDLFENSLIVVTADHGEAFGERGLIGHGMSVYQNQVHVPLLIKFPNSDRGRAVDTLASHVDILPTALRVLGASVPEDCQGRSLDEETADRERTVLAESYTLGGIWDIDPRFQRIQRALFSGSLKYVSSTPGSDELFDLAKDSEEHDNLVKDESEVSSMLSTQLASLISGAQTSRPTRVELKSDQLERLKSLGYVN